jgi:hypothetical protein
MTHKIVLGSGFSRDRAKLLIEKAPKGYVAEVREPKRTLEQNDRLWALLTKISIAKPMGRMHTPEDWKCIFMAACGWDVMFLEGLDGRPFPAGFRSSRLTKSQMSTLQDFIEAWAAEQGLSLSLDEAA